MRMALLLPLCLLAASPAFSQGAKAGETIGYINERLEHSHILNVDAAGVVKMKTPGGSMTFSLKEAAFNTNEQSGDGRVRVASEAGIEVWEGNHREDTKPRESFSCGSRTAAREAVAALRRLRDGVLDKDAPAHRKLNCTDKGLDYRTVGQAMDLINDHLASSVLLKVDPKGVLTIQGPDDLYRVDLTRAEFGYNGADGDGRVRIYGDWCIDTYRDGHKEESVPRESFSTHTRHGANEVIRALYYLKGAYTGLDTPRIDALRNVSRTRTHDYTTVAQALDAINDHLALSIILAIEPNGEFTVNASSAIYHFNLKDCTFERQSEERHLFGLIRFRAGEGVTIASAKGLKQYQDGRFYDTVDKETFSCEMESDSEFVMKALVWLQASLRK